MICRYLKYNTSYINHFLKIFCRKNLRIPGKPNALFFNHYTAGKNKYVTPEFYEILYIYDMCITEFSCFRKLVFTYVIYPDKYIPRQKFHIK